MPDIQFQIGGDAASLVRSSQEVVTAQEKMERGFETFAQSARMASEEVKEALREVEAYELKAAEATQASLQFSGAGPARRIRGYELAPAVVAAGQQVIQPGKDVQPLEFAATSAELAANRNYNQWLANEANAREKTAKESQLLSESIVHSAAADRVANQVRQQAATRLQAEAELRSQIELEAFGSRQEKRRSQAGHLVTPWANASPEFTDAMGLVGAGAKAFAAELFAVSAVTSMIDQTFEEVGKAGREFEGQIRPLLSIGNNISSANTIRQNVLGTSGGLGIAPGQVAGAMAATQTQGINLTRDQQQQAFHAGSALTTVAGGELEQNVRGVIGLLGTYADSIGGANEMASKLLATQQTSGVSIQELVQLMPQIAPSAQIMGHSFDEVAAALATVTNVAGATPKTINGLREVYVKLAEAQEKGIVHQGTLIEQFQELQALTPPDFVKLFGGRGATDAAILAKNTQAIADNLQRIASVKPEDVMGKAAALMSDPRQRGKALEDSLDQKLANVPVEMGEDPDIHHHNLVKKVSELGWANSGFKFMRPVWQSNWLSWLESSSIGVSQWRSGVNRVGEQSNDVEKVGIDKVVGDAYGGKTEAERDPVAVLNAQMTALELGTASNTFILDKNNERHFTNSDDADAYGKFASKYGVNHFADFQVYEQAQLQGNNTLADSIIKRLDETAAAHQQAAENLKNASTSLARSAARLYGGPAGHEDTHSQGE